MDKNSFPGLTGDAQTSYLLKREALRRAAETARGGSPAALDATLAQISAEVTAEALERKNRAEDGK